MFGKQFLFLSSVISLLFAVHAAELPVVVPEPQQMQWTTPIGEVWLAAEALTGILLDKSVVADLAVLRRLNEKTGVSLQSVKDGNMQIVLGALPDFLPARTRHEGYTLKIDPSGVMVAAETEHGIHNAIITLFQLYQKEKGFPCVSITDWPDQQLRGTYVPSIARAEERFDQFVALKLNLLLLEDGNLYDLDNQETCLRFQKLAERCRENFIEFVPELQSLGWGQFVLQREPRAVEARWVDRSPFPVKEGRIYAPDPSLPGPVTIVNASFEDGLEGWVAQTHHGRWTASSAEEAQVDHDGNALLLVLKEQGAVRVEQEVAVQPNARYGVRCRIRTQNVAGDGGAYIEVYGIGRRGDMALIGRNWKNISGTTDWHDSQAEFDTGAVQKARPGGAIAEEAQALPRDGYEKVRVYVRLQDATGTAWFDDVEIESLQSPNALANIVVTDRAKVLVESEDGKTIFEEGRDYTLEIPELKYPYKFGLPLQVVLADGSRIKEGDTLLLSFNQATLEDITCCPSEPLYDAFMRKSIAAVVEKLNPNYLHIGHDEPRFFNRDQRCTDRGLSNEELFADTIKNIYASAKAANPDIRVMLWDDAINPYQNGPHLDTSEVARHLPKDIIINVWWYDNVDWERQLDKSVAFFMDQGFEVTGSPWFRLPNARRWAEVFNTHKENSQALGIICTSWEEVPDPWAALEFTAEHTWSFGKPALPAQ
jgi:hypothetical protein